MSDSKKGFGFNRTDIKKEEKIYCNPTQCNKKVLNWMKLKKVTKQRTS